MLQHNLHPPFDIIRVGHVDLGVSDLGYAREFYGDLLGYHIEEETAESLYCRGMEERHHHSLILSKNDRPQVNRLAFKVRSEEDLDKAEAFFAGKGLPTAWVTRLAQGRTLHTRDPFGVPLEFYYEMTFVEDILQQYPLYHGGRIQRIDHLNLFHHDVNAAAAFYGGELGFQVTEATVEDINERNSNLWAVWMHRKGGVHDIAFTNGTGPRLHHIGVWVPAVTDILNFCDLLATSGHVEAFERGPGRHGISNAFFLYIRDRDGHRTELFAADYLTVDPDLPPRLWDLRDPQRQTLWGQAAPRSWFELGSLFDGVILSDSDLASQPIIAPE